MSNGERDPATAWRHVEGARDAIQQRFAVDWGLELPDSIFRFWAFMLSLGPGEQRAMAYLDLGLFGIMDLFEKPSAQPRDGFDIRVHGRFYRDPPEFLTFMSGGMDGLHYGLWFDDGRTCSGVASYFTNDGGGVGIPAGTPLEAVREEVEETWRAHFEDDDLHEGLDDDDLTEFEDGLRRLRETLMTFETEDRPEEGEEYADAYVDGPRAERQDPQRLMTLDGGGAFIPAATTVSREPQRDEADHDWCLAVAAELAGSSQGVAALVEDARRRCAEGDPGHALALGRDLHWISGGDPVHERHARELLVLAYQALDRSSLAGIVEATYPHRHLRHVVVLRGRNGD